MINSLIHQSKCIVLPGGRDYHHCVSVFENIFKIKIPSFPDRVLSVKSGGRHFVKVKSRDIPKLVQQGYADIGIAYTDVCQENILSSAPIAYQQVGDSALKLCLLLPKSQKKELESRLYSNKKPLVVATAYPRLLKKYLKTAERSGAKLNMTLSPFTPSGSVEAMVALGVADAVVDVVNTGLTARTNNLDLIELIDIFPAVVYRK